MWNIRILNCIRGQLKCDDTRAETRFRLSAKRTSPFKSAGASVQSTTGSRGVRISGSNAGYTTFRGNVKGTGYPLHSPVSPSLPLPCVTMCHHISTGVYQQLHLKYLCNLARYQLRAPWGWHDSVVTCRSVAICEIIVHLLVIVQNNTAIIVRGPSRRKYCYSDTNDQGFWNFLVRTTDNSEGLLKTTDFSEKRISIHKIKYMDTESLSTY